MSRPTLDEPGAEDRARKDKMERTGEGIPDPRLGHPTSKVRLRSTVAWPPNRRWVITGALAVVAVLVLLYALWRHSAEPETPAVPPATNAAGAVKFLMEQQWLIRMKLAQVEQQTVARQIISTGRVVPAANAQAVIAPPVGGIISGTQLARIGQPVLKGQAIAILQQTATSAEQAQVRAAAAQVQTQNAQLAVENARLEAERRTAEGDAEAARVRFDLAQKEFERARRLYDQKAFALRQLQAAESERDEASAAYQASMQRRDALAAARPITPMGNSVGSANASYTVRSPLSGYVTKVNKSIGEQVAPGEAILEVSSLGTVWVETPIFERDLSRITNKSAATFTTPAYPGREFRGTIVDVGAVINEQTRAATVIFQVPNPVYALRIGMQANVRLDAGQSVTAMMIPKEAVLDNEGKKIVYVLISGEEFQRREVTLGDEYGNHVAVLAGLQAGERVVTQGAYQIRLQELRPADAGAHSHET